MFSISFSDWLSIIFIAIIVLPMIRRAFGKRTTPQTIQVVRVDGVISNAGKGASLASIEKLLDKVEETKPKALIVRVNSPGGTVGASQAIHARLKRISAGGTKVVALMEDVAASGGLYIAMGADKVVAHAGTVTGSIGVIMQTFEISEILKDLRIKVETIRSGEFKDVGSMSRPMRPEDRALLEGMVNDTCSQFHEAVATARKLDVEKVKAFADGRVMSGRQALAVGLVDELGSLAEAQRAAESLAGIEEGKGKLAPLAPERRSLAERLGGGASASPFSAIADLLAEAQLSGIPLWLMRTR
jgi:protease-4